MLQRDDLERFASWVGTVRDDIVARQEGAPDTDPIIATSISEQVTALQAVFDGFLKKALELQLSEIDADIARRQQDRADVEQRIAGL